MLLGLHPQILHHLPPELEGSAQGCCVSVLYQAAELRNLSLWLSDSLEKSAQLGDEEQAALHHPARLSMCRNRFGGFCELGGSRSALKCCTRAAPDLHETDVGISDMPGVT